ncbi:MAG TPA: carbohydrate ABC transporter permease [Acidimicrobiales bacterium]|nr:carbohydrate ABC transporter permease [Acidimicrobiales bacterium]
MATAATTSGGKKAAWAAVDLVILAWVAVPLLWLLSLSFKVPSTITDASLWPHKWTWSNYSGIFNTSDFVLALRNSVVVAVITTVIAVLFGAMAAYAVARLRFPGKRLFVATALLVAMFPQISLIGPLFNIERALHLFDTWWGLIIPDVAFGLPLAIYTLSAFFREIPWDLERAAAVDGATPFQAFTRVIAPLAAPGLVTTAILVFIVAWNDFLFAISLTSTTRARTVPAAIAFFTGASQFENPIGSIAAAAVIITIPIIVFVLFFQRRIVAGLTSGAVKG